MARKVKTFYKYSDVTFCNNFKCRKKTCYRHICHNGNPYWISTAAFEGTDYCLKKQEESEKENNKCLN